MYRTKNFFKKHEKLRNDYDHCYVEMSDELKKRLKCNHGERLLKDSTIIYADWEYLLGKMNSCQNNTDNITQKKN